jgi:hypothetical protein
MSLFDAYIFVDWSAANGAGPRRPTADAVWVGELVPSLRHQKETYHRTRGSGVTFVLEILRAHVQAGRRVLVGFDFPYGFPAGFAASLTLPTGPQSWWVIWAELADRVIDTDNNISNRFAAAGELNTIVRGGRAGPFWGRPTGTVIAVVDPRSPSFPVQCAGGVMLERLRIVEARLRRVQETWKLFGAGSVGSQALVGIPYIYRLRRNLDLVRVSRVWPFETGFTPMPSSNLGPYVLHAEIWPGVVEERVQALVDSNAGLIRDRAQVRAMCEWTAECDEAETLPRYFDVPTALNPQQVRSCIEHEGWVLGAT